MLFRSSYVIGDRLTLNEFLALAEEARGGQKFEVVTDSLEQLQQGKITELPGHKPMYDHFPKEMLQGLFAMFGVLFEKGKFDFEGDLGEGKKSLNEQFPDVKVRGVKEVLHEAWGGK